MRLLNVETFQLEEFYETPPPYAILSHTWGSVSEEVSFRDVIAGRLTAAARPIKLSGCCKQAQQDGCKYAWIDTCCIDKTNSVELQEAINSMFRWYQDARICYAFLSDVPAGDDDPHNPESTFLSSRWFQRGWTLQELLAPRDFRFYNSRWHHLGTKGGLCGVIEKITGIPSPFLLGLVELRSASVAQRMSWAAGRVTKRDEDVAYCLLGIFGVNMPMIYGEGRKAFRRLQEHIIKDIGDDSILAWGLGLGDVSRRTYSTVISGGVLAAAPSDFVNSGQIASRKRHSGLAFDVQAGSLRLSLSLSTTATGNTLGLLHCGPENNTDVVGIPLAAAFPSGEYIRLRGLHAVLVPRPASKGPMKVVQIRIERELKSPSASSQPYWFHVQTSVADIELIDVEPLSCWHKERALIEAAPEPDSDDVCQTITRFRCKAKASFDFVIILEALANGATMQAQCHTMIAARDTSLVSITRRFGDLRPGALEKQEASNGVLNLHVQLEPIARERRCIMRLTVSPGPPAVTINATLELQHLDLMVALKRGQAVEDNVPRQPEELNPKQEETIASFDQIKTDQRELKGLLEKL